MQNCVPDLFIPLSLYQALLKRGQQNNILEFMRKIIL